jgi:hypothetical protein
MAQIILGMRCSGTGWCHDHLAYRLHRRDFLGRLRCSLRALAIAGELASTTRSKGTQEAIALQLEMIVRPSNRRPKWRPSDERPAQSR